MGGYLDMQQQLEVMNLRFGEAMNEMDILRIEVASLRDGPVCRYPKGRGLRDELFHL
jgi:hypothetical protein